jgi:hypothetical protein
MSTLDDDQIRLATLKILLNNAKEDPGSFGVDRATLQKALGVSEKEMDFNMIYLEERGLVRLTKFMGSLWAYASISAYGMDVVAHRDRFADKFPFTKAQITITGNVYGNVVQAVSSTVTFSQQVTDAFKQAYDQVEKRTDLSMEKKQATTSILGELQQELQKPKPDAGKIQQGWDWIKCNAEWLIPTLSNAAIEGLKMALGI